MELRPAPRFVVLGVLGLVPALFAVASDLALAVTAGWDLLLLVAFAVDAALCPRRRDVDVSRRVKRHLQQGAEAPVAIALSARRGGRAIVIDEPAPELLPSDVVERPVAVRLIAGGTARAGYTVCPRRRGRFELGHVNVLADGPLGLARRRLTLVPAGDSTVHVYPALGDLDRGALDPDLMMAELGIRRVRRRAEGTELESLRDAVIDDELRKIDWRATARRGRLTARNYELEKNHEVLICVDCGRLMGALHRPAAPADGAVPLTKLDHAIGAALRLAAVALKNGDRVGLFAFGRDAGAFVRPDRGPAQIGRLLEAAHALQPESAESSYIRALGEVRRRQKKRALVVFLTDFVDREASGAMVDVLGLLARKHAVLFVALRDPHIRTAADAAVGDLAGAYRSIAALGLEEARAEVIEGLSASGVRALDLPPEAVLAGAIQAYLALRAVE